MSAERSTEMLRKRTVDGTMPAAGRESAHMTAFERANLLVPQKSLEKAILPANNTTVVGTAGRVWDSVLNTKRSLCRDFGGLPGYGRDAATAHFSSDARRVWNDIIFNNNNILSYIPQPVIPEAYKGHNSRSPQAFEEPWCLDYLANLNKYHLNSQTLCNLLDTTDNICDRLFEKKENKRSWEHFLFRRGNKVALDISKTIEEILKDWKTQALKVQSSFVEHGHVAGIDKYLAMRQATVRWRGIDGPKEGHGVGHPATFYHTELPILHQKISLGEFKIAAAVVSSGIGAFRA